MTPEEMTALKLGIARIPDIMLDTTDRNRTSPFAFTGNRFEFRAVGSSANCAASIIALDAAVAHQLNEFRAEVDDLINARKGKDEAIFQVLKKLIIESKPVRFEGDGYSEEWKAEAKKRGLTNITSAPEAISKYLDKSSMDVLIGENVFNEVELKGRVEVEYEKFSKKVQIESRILGDIAINHIVPTAVAYQNRLIENLCGLKQLFDAKEYDVLSEDRKDLIREISSHVTAIKKLVKRMTEERHTANTAKSEHETAVVYDSVVRPTMEEIRSHIDDLELVIDDDFWPMPKYRELLFS
jgi:glutamine synthetase